MVSRVPSEFFVGGIRGTERFRPFTPITGTTPEQELLTRTRFFQFGGGRPGRAGIATRAGQEEARKEAEFQANVSRSKELLEKSKEQILTTTEIRELEAIAKAFPTPSRITPSILRTVGLSPLEKLRLVQRQQLEAERTATLSQQEKLNLEKDILEVKRGKLERQIAASSSKTGTFVFVKREIEKFNKEVKSFVKKQEALQTKAGTVEAKISAFKQPTPTRVGDVVPATAAGLLETGIARELEISKEIKKTGEERPLTFFEGVPFTGIATTKEGGTLFQEILAPKKARTPTVGVQPIEEIAEAIVKRGRETTAGFEQLGGELALASIKGFQMLGVPTKPSLEFVEAGGRLGGRVSGAAIALPEAALSQAVSQAFGLREKIIAKVTKKPLEPLKLPLTGIPEQLVRGAKELPFGIGALLGAEEAVTPEGVFLTRPAITEFVSAGIFLGLPGVAKAKVKKVPTKAPAKVPKVTKIGPMIPSPAELVKVGKKVKPSAKIKVKTFEVPTEVPTIKAPIKGVSAVGRSIEDFAIVAKRPGKKPPVKKPPTKLEELIARERIQILGEKPVVELPERLGRVPEVVKRFRQAEQSLLERASRPLAERVVAGRLTRLQTELALERALKPLTTEIAFQRQLLPSLAKQARKAIQAEIRLETKPVVKAITKIERKVGRKFSKLERELLAAREDVLFTLVREPKIKIQEALFRLKREAGLEITPVAETVSRIEKRIGRKLTKAEREIELARQDVVFTLFREPTIKAQEALFRARRGLAQEFRLELKPVERAVRRVERKFKRRVTRPLTEEFAMVAQDFRDIKALGRIEGRKLVDVPVTKVAETFQVRAGILEQELLKDVVRARELQSVFQRRVVRPLRKEVKGPILEEVFAAKKQLRKFEQVLETEAEARIRSVAFLGEAGLRVPIRQVARAQIAAERVGKRVGFELGLFKPFRPFEIPVLEARQPIVKRPEPFKFLIIEPLTKKKGIPKLFKTPEEFTKSTTGAFFREFKEPTTPKGGQIQVTKTGAVTIQKVKEVTKVKAEPKVITEPPQPRVTLRLRVPTIQETLTGQQQKFRELTGFGLRRPLRFGEALKEIQAQRFGEVTVQRLRVGERLRFGERVALRPAEALKLAEELVLRERIRLREGVRFRTGFPPVTVLREITRRPPPKLVPIILPFPEIDAPEFKEPVDEPQKGFNVFLRRKGKLLRQNRVPLTRPSAFGLGFLLADESVARSGVVREAKKRGKSVPALNAATARAFKFRKPKGKTKLARDSFVERSRFAIDSIGELQGITARGRAKAERNRAIRKVLRIKPKKRKKRKRRRR